MSTDELRLGDLVFVSEKIIDESDLTLINNIITRVKSIYGSIGINARFDENGGFAGCILIENITPIPLTDEILEKNGYCYNETREAWELIPNDGFGICRDEEDNNNFYFCLGVFDPFRQDSDITYHNITKVEYVHDLQHILKDCKIKKMIAL